MVPPNSAPAPRPDPALERIFAPPSTGAGGHVPGGDEVWDALPDDPAPTGFGEYVVLGEIARGGMGVVYRARQQGTQRVVALKTISPALLAVPGARERFQRESEAAAALDHPHILPIHHVGVAEGVPFFSMKLAEGGSLATAPRRPPREVAALLAKVARAVQHAHERGVLHRDLKPANILLDATGEPFVADFGLARFYQRTDDPTLTQTGVGTPHFVSPEQARGETRTLTVASDVYALGAILYAQLAGRPPFAGETALETLRLVIETSPPPLRARDPGIPRDLEIICLKCLEKDPAARYRSARALADDLEAFVAGRSISARPATLPERAARWTRANPVLAATLGFAALLLVAVAVGSTIAAARFREATRRAQEAEREERAQLRQALLAQARASRLTGRAGQRFATLEAVAKAAAIRPDLELRNEAIAALALPDLRIERLWPAKRLSYGPLAFDPTLQFYANEPADGVLTVRRASDQAEVARWTPPGGPGARVKFIGPWAESGTRLSALYADGAVRFFRVGADGALTLAWELPGWNPPTPPVGVENFVAYAPDEARVAVGVPTGGVSLRAADTGAELARLAPEARADSLTWSPDGRELVVAGRRAEEARIISASDGRVRVALKAEMGVEALAWSPDGRTVAASSNRGPIFLFDAPTGRLRHALRGHTRTTTMLGFSPDGALLASSGRDYTLRLWEPLTGTPLLLLSPPAAEPVLRFTRDGRRLALSPYGADAGTAQVAANDVLRYVPHRLDGDALAEFGAADYSADGRLIVVAGRGGVRLCDGRDGRELVAWPLDPGARKSAQFDADGRWLWISSVRSGLQRHRLTWNSPEQLEVGPAEVLDPTPDYLLTSPGGLGTRRAFVREDFEQVLLRDLTGAGQVTLTLPQSGIWQAAVSPDGRFVATAPASRDLLVDRKSCRLWNAQTGELVRAFQSGRGGTVTFSRSGRYLYSSANGPSHVWELEPWRQVIELPGELEDAAFSPDDRLLAAVDESSRVHLFSLPEGRRLAMLEGRASRLYFGAHGATLVGVSSDGAIWRWDLRNLRRELKTLGLDWEAPDFPAASPEVGPISARLAW
ncbi:MAG: protein kinase [Verrucomicrobia bacterium]|nr:protein kinase [Verrucomicrobiota bacterium]